MKREIKQFLIEKAVAGDAEAFSEIYFLLRDSIYNFARRMTAENVIAEDITQEVFMFFIKFPEKFDDSRGELFPFLCGVARHKIYDYFRKNGTRTETIDIDGKDYEDVSNGSGKSPLKIVLEREFAEKIETAIGKLAPLQREVLILRETEDFSYEEIARLTETDVGIVKSRLYRARRTLGKELAPYLKEEKLYEMH